MSCTNLIGNVLAEKGHTRVVCGESISSEAGLSEIRVWADGRVMVHGKSWSTEVETGESWSTEIEIEYELGVPGREGDDECLVGKILQGGKEVRAKIKDDTGYVVCDQEGVESQIYSHEDTKSLLL